jgi:hypothetical protein
MRSPEQKDGRHRQAAVDALPGPCLRDPTTRYDFWTGDADGLVANTEAVASAQAKREPDEM